MRQKLKQLFAILVILILLPYIITIFINGPSIAANASVGNNYVKIQTATGVVKMPIDEYGLGVLAKEIPITYDSKTIEVQAILVRTSLYKQVQEEGKDVVFREWFWTQKDMEEEWGAAKYTANIKKLKTAWENTEGMILVYGDKPAYAPFHKVSNGKTRVGSEMLHTEQYPYLTMKECAKDLEAEEALATASIEKKEFAIQSYDSAGYVTNITFDGKNYTGEEFRKTNGLASSCFTIQDYEGKLRITTQGIGHGLGLSQYSAQCMAQEGKTREEILQYFFEGVEIKEVAEILLDAE